MSTHNICLLHKEVDKSTLVVIFKITKLFDSALIGACAVTGSNTVGFKIDLFCMCFNKRLFLKYTTFV